MSSTIERIIQYQKEKGTEFNPQLILFTLSGCPVCKQLITELMLDGYSYEEFDCNTDEHSDIADYLESSLGTNHYPIIFISYPESKIIITEDMEEDVPVYIQISKYLN